MFNLAVLHIRRIPNNHIKPIILHNPIELHKPVEGLVTLLPLLKTLAILFFLGDVIAVNAVLGGEIAIKLYAQQRQFFTELLLALGYIPVTKIELYLEPAKILEAALDLLRLLLNAR